MKIKVSVIYISVFTKISMWYSKHQHEKVNSSQTTTGAW